MREPTESDVVKKQANGHTKWEPYIQAASRPQGVVLEASDISDNGGVASVRSKLWAAGRARGLMMSFCKIKDSDGEYLVTFRKREDA